MTTLESRTISIRIERPWEAVYAYAADPHNMPDWGHGLGQDFRQDGDEWVFRAGAGVARVCFTPLNEFGVLDHDVYPPGMDPVHVAMRVMPNGNGAEVTFLLVATPGMSQADFERDAEAVGKDLATLKALLETPPR